MAGSLEKNGDMMAAILKEANQMMAESMRNATNRCITVAAGWRMQTYCPVIILVCAIIFLVCLQN